MPFAGSGAPSTSRSMASATPTSYAKLAERLAGVFPDFTLEVFDERHHLDRPHRAEPDRLATSLRGLWDRADAAATAAD